MSTVVRSQAELDSAWIARVYGAQITEVYSSAQILVDLRDSDETDRYINQMKGTL